MAKEKEVQIIPKDIVIDIYSKMNELMRAAHKSGVRQIEPGSVYLSKKCLRSLRRYSIELQAESPYEYESVFGLRIYQVDAAGYHVRVAPALITLDDIKI